MKSEKGITLLSLIIYMILLIIVISVLTRLSTMFYSNAEVLNDNTKNLAEFNKFNMYFIESVKNNKSAVVNNNDVIFEDGTIYTYSEIDKGIYKDKVKICNNVELCEFSTESQLINFTNKQIITVTIALDSEEIFNVSNDYVLKYW